MAEKLGGIFFMMPTPFDDKGEIIEEDIPRLVDLAARAGCAGVVCLGEMGEHQRLMEEERGRIVRATVAQARGKLRVVVGATAQGNYGAARYAAEARELGADAVMVAPPSMARTNLDAVFGYYKGINDAVDAPIVVQDFPQSTNVVMPPVFIARLNQELDNALYLKLEDPPTPPKVTSVRNITGEDMGIFGGLGGAFLLEELLRGAVGTMTGFAYPEVLVAVHKHVVNGQHDMARQVFYQYLPLIRYENQQGVGLSLRKEVLKRRGVLQSSRLRLPGPEVDETTRQELFRTLASVGLE
ncbi:MAG: dihydrodipicolinate synthase family protein [Chloroflexi bacterium]|nr:dihydrodipicolinate synthase family protein [Chloroflexota bacterium]